ncbi:MAG: DNA alkylation repair protein [Polyangiaceae bacterium]|nr:DNA alkylation repair protein [Polyangiaceae bacterium]
MKLQIELRKRFTEMADAERAKGQQAYMKSAMPYYGIQSAPMKAVCKELFAKWQFETSEDWQSAALTLWREAQYREERYAAIELVGYKTYKKYQNSDLLPMYEEMIVTGAWWDYVDTIASHQIGGLLKKEPKVIKKAMLTWSRDSDSWKRRTSIICQISLKAATDLDLLYRAIEPNLADKDFFIRKAIGWALRSYAYVDATEVARYVAEHDGELSGLSKREALKHIG